MPENTAPFSEAKNQYNFLSSIKLSVGMYMCSELVRWIRNCTDFVAIKKLCPADCFDRSWRLPKSWVSLGVSDIPIGSHALRDTLAERRHFGGAGKDLSQFKRTGDLEMREMG